MNPLWFRPMRPGEIDADWLADLNPEEADKFPRYFRQSYWAVVMAVTLDYLLLRMLWLIFLPHTAGFLWFFLVWVVVTLPLWSWNPPWQLSPGVYLAGLFCMGRKPGEHPGISHPIWMRVLDPGRWVRVGPLALLLGLLFLLTGTDYVLLSGGQSQWPYFIYSQFMALLCLVTAWAWLTGRSWGLWATGLAIVMLWGPVWIWGWAGWYGDLFVTLGMRRGHDPAETRARMSQVMTYAQYMVPALAMGLGWWAWKRIRSGKDAPEIVEGLYRRRFVIAGSVIFVGMTVWQGWQVYQRQTVEATLVMDRAALFTPRQIADLRAYHDKLLTLYGIDYRVLTVPRSQNLEQLAHATFQSWQIGNRSATGQGMLLVVDRGNDRVRLELSAGLEGALTDAFLSYLQHRQMIPFFASGRVADGILAATELIISRVGGVPLDTLIGTPQGSRGGGVSNTARIGAGKATDSGDESFAIHPRSDMPLAVVEAYFQAMAARDGRANLPIYSHATQAMLGRWTVTPAQMDTLVHTYRRCGPAEVKIDDRGMHAVVRYPISQRQCALFFWCVKPAPGNSISPCSRKRYASITAISGISILASLILMFSLLRIGASTVMVSR
ncbi:MAG TPA: TPM domain-containing protein [Methylothermaceae bacterium]|nr:TPM domain-containing protein [Methylothermaceae bacterium]